MTEIQDRAVIDELLRVARYYYPDGEVGPTIKQWDRAQRIDMKAWSLMTVVFGDTSHCGHSAAWARVLSAVGLRHPEKSEGIRASKRVWQMEMDEDWKAPDIRKTGAGMYQVRAGLRAIERERVIREWNPTRHIWEEAARQVVYELC